MHILTVLAGKLVIDLDHLTGWFDGRSFFLGLLIGVIITAILNLIWDRSKKQRSARHSRRGRRTIAGGPRETDASI